jgi:hypothetical protein
VKIMELFYHWLMQIEKDVSIYFLNDTLSLSES